MNIHSRQSVRSEFSTAKSELGASAILIALCMILFLGMAAFAIDLGFGLSERRNDVTAADMGVMAGAVSSLGSNAQVRDQILSFARQNLPTAYSNAAWQTIWEGCTDPELASLNTTGFNFIPVAAPTGWTVSSPWCISIDPAGFVRVRLPNQIVDTTFGRAIGTNQFSTNADAIARWNSRGGGGILPFALVSTAGDGTHVCLRDASGGLAEEPCDGSDTGNFGALESPLYGNVALGTTQNCTGSPKKDLLAINIANGLVGDEKRDTCPVIASGETPDTLNTFQGLSNGTQEGLATGPVPGGFTPRLQQGSNPKRNVYGSSLDDRPLWDYLDGSLTGFGAGGTIPDSCVKSTFNNSLPDQDWSVPADGLADDAESWEHISKCLLDHVAMGASAPIMFLETIGDSPRFSYVPQFWESTLPSGNGYLHVLRFKATWLQATWWKKNATSIKVFHPGEGGPSDFTGGGNWDLIQVSGMVMPDLALPIPLRGTPGPAGGLSPFTPELYR
jgi:hypothetical protein